MSRNGQVKLYSETSILAVRSQVSILTSSIKAFDTNGVVPRRACTHSSFSFCSRTLCLGLSAGEMISQHCSQLKPKHKICVLLHPKILNVFDHQMFVMFSETFLINITEYQYQTRIIKILTTVLSFFKLVLPTTTQQEGNLFSIW